MTLLIIAGKKTALMFVCVYSWLKKAIIAMPVLRSAILCYENISVSESFVSVSMKFVERPYKLAIVQKGVS